MRRPLATLCFPRSGRKFTAGREGRPCLAEDFCRFLPCALSPRASTNWFFFKKRILRRRESSLSARFKSRAWLERRPSSATSSRRRNALEGSRSKSLRISESEGNSRIGLHEQSYHPKAARPLVLPKKGAPRGCRCAIVAAWLLSFDRLGPRGKHHERDHRGANGGIHLLPAAEARRGARRDGAARGEAQRSHHRTGLRAGALPVGAPGQGAARLRDGLGDRLLNALAGARRGAEGHGVLHRRRA